jgi:hypothetical protein
MAKILKKKNIQKEQTSAGIFSSLSPMKKDFLVIGFIYLVTLVMFSDVVFRNEIFSHSGDTASAQAITQAGKILEETEHIEPQWFPYIFSGMPSFGSLMYLAKDINYVEIILKIVAKLFFFFSDLSWMIMHFFVGAVGVYLFVRYLGLQHFSALISALTFLLCPFIVGMGQAGHGSKLMALSFIPYLFLATQYVLEKRNILSLGILSVTVGTLLLTNHVQIVYYGFLCVGLFVLYNLVYSFRENKKIAVTQSGLFVAAFIIGFAISAFIYLSTYEYAQYSIRGGGETGVSGGLNIEYATNWSVHPLETLTYLIPSFFGFQSPFYWGWMPFTESSVYIGVVPLLFAAVALFFQRKKHIVFFLSLTVILFFISFGKHFYLYNIMFEYVPFFNKFRAPQMILLLVPFSLGIVAAYGCDYLFRKPEMREKLFKPLLSALGILAVILLIGFFLKSSMFPSGSFTKEGDERQYNVEQIAQLKTMRFDMLKDDVIKFSLIGIAGIALLLLFSKNIISPTILGGFILALFFIDMGVIDKHYLQTYPNQQSDEQFSPTQTIQFLRQDTSVYRVFPIRQFSSFDNSWMYYGVQTIGGYSPAKLKIYQEMVDSCLYRGWDPQFPLNMNIINMLNVKYVIADGRLPEEYFKIAFVDQREKEIVFENPSYLQRAFFVDSLIVVDKSTMFQIMNTESFNPKHTAIVQQSIEEKIYQPLNAKVHIIKQSAHRIELATQNAVSSLLVLSEIYYPVGWKAFVDGKETMILRTNSILRSIVVPSGNHTIEFVYESKVYQSGLLVSYIGWVLAFFFIGTGIYLLTRKKKIEDSILF